MDFIKVDSRLYLALNSK